MSFTRRQYEQIAIALKRAHERHNDTQVMNAEYGIELVEQQLTALFKMDNPRFDESRFDKAIHG